MPSDDDWSPSCWDCGREFSRNHLNMHPVHIENEDEPGYQRVDVPLCDSCRKDRMHTHECYHCEREYLDISDAAECCQHVHRTRGEP